MFNGESGYSLSDIAAVSGKNNENMWNDGVAGAETALGGLLFFSYSVLQDGEEMVGEAIMAPQLEKILLTVLI